VDFKRGDILESEGGQRRVIYKILAESEGKYKPPVGTLECLVCDKTGVPFKMNTGVGPRYFGVSIWPSEFKRNRKIGWVNPSNLDPVIEAREKQAAEDVKHMHNGILSHFPVRD
jgi:hypothetical protein